MIYDIHYYGGRKEGDEARLPCSPKFVFIFRDITHGCDQFPRKKQLGDYSPKEKELDRREAKVSSPVINSNNKEIGWK